jgi:hypothetical protein
VKPIHRGDVTCLVLNLSLERLKNDVGQVDPDNLIAIGRQGVHLPPQECTAGASFVLNDRIDRWTLSLQNHLLVTRREVGLAPRGKGLPVKQVFLRTGLGKDQRGVAGAQDEGDAPQHSADS